MKKNIYTIVLLFVFLLFVIQMITKLNDKNKPQKACCNQSKPNTNQSDDHVILNSLNKFIVSL